MCNCLAQRKWREGVSCQKKPAEKARNTQKVQEKYQAESMNLPSSPSSHCNPEPYFRLQRQGGWKPTGQIIMGSRDGECCHSKKSFHFIHESEVIKEFMPYSLKTVKATRQLDLHSFNPLQFANYYAFVTFAGLGVVKFVTVWRKEK